MDFNTEGLGSRWHKRCPLPYLSCDDLKSVSKQNARAYTAASSCMAYCPCFDCDMWFSQPIQLLYVRSSGLNEVCLAFIGDKQSQRQWLRECHRGCSIE